MHFVTSVCVKRYVDPHEHMSRSYSSKSRTCACHELICREHPTPLACDVNQTLFHRFIVSFFIYLQVMDSSVYVTKRYGPDRLDQPYGRLCLRAYHKISQNHNSSSEEKNEDSSLFHGKFSFHKLW